jgi:hypothetical protein
MAGGGGFEPPLTGPEPVVLPLDDPPACEGMLIIQFIQCLCYHDGAVATRRPSAHDRQGAHVRVAATQQPKPGRHPPLPPMPGGDAPHVPLRGSGSRCLVVLLLRPPRMDKSGDRTGDSLSRSVSRPHRGAGAGGSLIRSIARSRRSRTRSFPRTSINSNRPGPTVFPVRATLSG